MRGAPAAAAAALAILFAAGCVSAPRPTAEALHRSSNLRAIVEGLVRDPQGRPVPGVSVQGLPREKHLPWSPASITDEHGRFRLTLVAPGEYGFVIAWKGMTVVTSRPDDPARVLVSLQPGQWRDRIELVFRREEWDRALRAPGSARPPL